MLHQIISTAVVLRDPQNVQDKSLKIKKIENTILLDFLQ